MLSQNKYKKKSPGLMNSFLSSLSGGEMHQQFSKTLLIAILVLDLHLDMMKTENQ
jgi:hypothetical protein